MPCSRFFYVANESFNAIRENIILVKISEFTVSKSRIRVYKAERERERERESLDISSILSIMSTVKFSIKVSSSRLQVPFGMVSPIVTCNTK